MMTAPQDPTPEYHPFPEHDWVPPEPPRYRRWPWMALAGVAAAAALIGTVAVATQQTGPAAAAAAATPGRQPGPRQPGRRPPQPAAHRWFPPPRHPRRSPAPAAASAAMVPAPPAGPRRTGPGGRRAEFRQQDRPR